MAKVKTLRWGRMLTGSGIFLRNVCAWPANWKDRSVRQQGLGAEVVRMYRQELKLPTAARVFCDTTASAAPVGLLSCGVYHTLVVAPATSNTVAKCVLAISDTLVTTVFAQAGKCRVATNIFACDTAPELHTEAPKVMVKVHPLQIDLKNTQRLKSRESALGQRRRELS